MILRGIYRILGDVLFSKNYSIAQGKSPANQQKILSAMEEYSNPVVIECQGKAVTVFFYSDRKVFAEVNLPDSEELKQYFTDTNKSLSAENELWLESLEEAVEKVLGIVKYFLDYSQLEEHLCQLDKTLIRIGEEWTSCVDRRELAWEIGGTMLAIENDTITTIDQLLKAGVNPFIGLRFLHKAKDEILLRDKWLYTALAAELSIKEFIYAKNPVLKTEWEQGFSPSIPKLLDSFVNQYFTISDTDKNILKDNAKVRNTIVHKPSDAKNLRSADCILYMDTVERVIFSMLLELHPNNAVIQERIAKVKNDKHVPG